MENKKSTIGITGGIGSGKSVVSRVLRCNGFPVYDCDFEAKYIMVTDPEVKQSLIKRLGKDIYETDGSLNRRKLSSLLFKDNEVRNYVNGIVHSAVREDIKRKRSFITGKFFIESAIIVTGGLEPLCNEIWIINAPLEKRIERVIKRDNTDRKSVEERINTQQAELTLIKNTKIIELQNNDFTPLLPLILKLTHKFNNHKTYSISC